MRGIPYAASRIPRIAADVFTGAGSKTALPPRNDLLLNSGCDAQHDICEVLSQVAILNGSKQLELVFDYCEKWG